MLGAFKMSSIIYAPINVKPTGGRQGIGPDFDIFQKIAVKFPTPGQKCEDQIPALWISLFIKTVLFVYVIEWMGTHTMRIYEYDEVPQN